MGILSIIVDSILHLGGVDPVPALAKRNEEKGQSLNWQVSIVDLLKLLDLDSSLEARKRLADELGYTGTAPDGSAEKNIWLHKAVMQKVAERGIKIPSGMT